MRVTVDDILYRIAQDLRCYSGADPIAAIEEFVVGCAFQLRMSITTDFEETELDYLERFGKGHTYYFRLVDYEHGKSLAKSLYYIVTGGQPDISQHDGGQFRPEEKLFLFIHIQNVAPPPAKRDTSVLSHIKISDKQSNLRIN